MKCQNMIFWKWNENLGDIQWIFAKTAEKKTIKELEKLFEDPSVFTEKISGWLEGSKVSSEAFLQWLDKPENFKKIFKIVD